MHVMTLKEIQNVSLDILQDVHNFCVSHDIGYSLAYGTLLGAIRHKGFIPWDDDIDLYMTRPEYERFCREYRSECGNILVNVDDSCICFARVCDTQRTFCETILPWTKNRSAGLWIDIFPLDAVSDDRSVFSTEIKKANALYSKQLKGRGALVRPGCKYSLKRNLIQFAKCILFFQINLNKINEKLIQLSTQLPYGSTAHCSQLVCGGNRDKEFFSIDLFDSYIDAEFEGRSFKIAKGWKKILELNYSDYMQLPPMEARIQHSNHTTFYMR